MRIYKKGENICYSGPNIVVIGGGTGASTLLKGLKRYTENITAIITVGDDGGGSGVLREDLGMLPPGDIRACLLALANTEPTMEKLFQYRFDNGSLKGQSFGNLFLAAMNGIYGNFEKAIKETSNVLAITGKVYPMTLENVKLIARLDNGELVEGESMIPKVAADRNAKINRIFMEPKKSNPIEEGVLAIKNADLIVLGPGSLYTSVIPNLLVNNIVDKIYGAKAKKVYVGNIMTQRGETDNYTLSDHVQSILNHSREGFFDYVIANDQEIPSDILKKYEDEGAKPVNILESDRIKLRKKNISLIEADLLELESQYIKHHAVKLSEILIKIAEENM